MNNGRLKITLRYDANTFGSLTREQLAKLEQARSELEIAVNSQEFKNWCLSYRRKVKVITKKFLGFTVRSHYEYRNQFAHTFLSNQEVYNKIMSGAETLDPIVDYEANINVKVDWKGSSRVLGHTYPNSIYQWIHGWFLKSGSVPSLRGNLFHEWCHKVGFKHPYRYSISRQQSVPYELGYFMRDFKIL